MNTYALRGDLWSSCNYPGGWNDIRIIRHFQKDEEWKEYEEVKKDYSGLKIESLKIDADGANGDDDDDEDHFGEDGEKIRGKKSDGGPWNKAASSSSAAQEDSRSSSPGKSFGAKFKFPA